MTACPKCQSEKIIPDVFIEDKGMKMGSWSLVVRVDEKPDALLFKGRHNEALKACICGECGYTELYASNPHELYEAYTRVR